MLDFARIHRRNLNRNAPAESGAASVEFALILPVLMLILFGIIQYGYYFFAAQNGSSVLREVTRKVAVGDCPNDTDITSYVSTRLGGLSYSGLTVTRTWENGSAAIGDKVTVDLEFKTLDMNLPFLPLPGGEAIVSRSADARVEDLTPGSCA